MPELGASCPQPHDFAAASAAAGDLPKQTFRFEAVVCAVRVLPEEADRLDPGMVFVELLNFACQLTEICFPYGWYPIREQNDFVDAV